MAMMICPTCQLELQRVDSGSGWVWACSQCRGRALNLNILRKGIEQQFINQLWGHVRALREANKSGTRDCPSCQQKMAAISMAREEQQLVLDVCPLCQLVWFDDQETELLPMRETVGDKQQEPELSPEAREAIALAKVKLIAERAERENARDEVFHTEGFLFDLVREFIRSVRWK